ncbi:unnamed protein product [Psylliodes chrysocephalus]|uniref:CCHC-type domain-containing protein n=1 Tax=Psylliodes chrysocephalus TaxID=3402493 RepID=A0A9P0CVT2_9CUCU|nr:unnamed protein product [Psylliodes chrysocephala]
MNTSTDTIDLCGGDQPAEESSDAGRSDLKVKDTEEKKMQIEPTVKPRIHSRLNLLGRGERCNSVSLPDLKKRKLADTSMLDPSPAEPYKQKLSPEAFILKEAIEKNTDLVKKLVKLLEIVPNTHKGIKEITRSMKKNSKEFEMESLTQWINEHKYEKIEKITFDTETQTRTQTKVTSEASTQTEPWHDGKHKATLKSLEGIESLDNYSQVEGMTWEKELFKQTEVIVGNPLTTGDKITKVVLVEPKDPEMNNSIQRLYREKFPELASIQEDFEVLEQTTKIKSKESAELSTRKVIKVTHDGSTKDIWEKLNKIREETATDDKVAIHHIANITNENLQKMTEAVFHRSNTRVAIFTTASTKDSEKERTTYGMLVSEGGKSYKEILGKVKAIVGTNQSAKAIRSLRSTKDGKLLLTLEKDQQALNNLQNALKDSTMGLKTKRLGRAQLTAIHIRGMEADTTTDIKNAVIEVTGTWDEENKLSELRPLSNDTLAATLTIKPGHADKILEEGTLRIGLVKCRIEKRLNITKCQRCWSHEHYSDKCTGPDRSKNCYRCGLSDHNFKECNNDEACLLCNEKGHRVGTMKCPEFKTALKTARLEDRKKTSFKLTRGNEDEKPAGKSTDLAKKHETDTSEVTPMEDQDHIDFCKLIDEACATVEISNTLGDASSPTQA